MPHIDSCTPGSFCWIELATSDQAAAKALYSGLFGWSSYDAPIGPEDFYTMFELEGRKVAAAYTLRGDEQSMGIPPHWNLYVGVKSADESAARAVELGGTLLAGPLGAVVCRNC